MILILIGIYEEIGVAAPQRAIAQHDKSPRGKFICNQHARNQRDTEASGSRFNDHRHMLEFRPPQSIDVLDASRL